MVVVRGQEGMVQTYVVALHVDILACDYRIYLYLRLLLSSLIAP